MKNIKIILLIAVTLLVTAALVLPGSPAGAIGDKTCYLTQPGMTFSASQCHDYVWSFGWGATTSGLMNVFLNANPFSVSFSGPVGFARVYSRTEIAQFWGPMHALPPAQVGWDCPMPQVWFADLYAPIGTDLQPGKYNFTIFAQFDHPLTDGTTACKWEGSPLGRNIYQGSGQFNGSFTIIP